MNGRRAMDEIAVKIFCIFFWYIKLASSRKGLISEVYFDKKFYCPLTSREVYTVTSEIQCTHRCLRHETCDLINYNTEKEIKDNCEIFIQGDRCSIENVRIGWKAIKFELQKNKKKVYRSCREIYNDNPSSAPGFYNLEIGRHYCFMGKSAESCGVGGWTLAMKVDGTTTNLGATSALWANNDVYNVENGLQSIYQNEAKFSAFNELSFDDVCIGIKVSTDIRWLLIPGIPKKSLRSIFATGTELYTNRGRSLWKGLIASSSLQANCNKEGFNLKSGNSNTILVRLGYVANEQNDCNSCDSFIGMGSRWSQSCGNVATSTPDNGDKQTAGMCYILIK